MIMHLVFHSPHFSSLFFSGSVHLPASCFPLNFLAFFVLLLHPSTHIIIYPIAVNVSDRSCIAVNSLISTKVGLSKYSLWFFYFCLSEIKSFQFAKPANNDYYKYQITKSNEHAFSPQNQSSQVVDECKDWH